jgi:RNA recognition motif-containing protein
MKREFCTEFKLANLFSECGTVAKVHVLVQSKEKNMALIRFGNVEDSVRAMATFHNHDILGRKLQISFTKSKF